MPHDISKCNKCKSCLTLTYRTPPTPYSQPPTPCPERAKTKRPPRLLRVWQNVLATLDKMPEILNTFSRLSLAFWLPFLPLPASTLRAALNFSPRAKERAKEKESVHLSRSGLQSAVSFWSPA